jgi:hypothetical protein
MTHAVFSIPAIIIAAIVVGIPFNWLLGGTRTAAQRITIALISVPATVVLAGIGSWNQAQAEPCAGDRSGCLAPGGSGKLNWLVAAIP